MREGKVVGFFGIMGHIRVTPGWEDDPVRRQDGRRRMWRRYIGWHKGRLGWVQ